MAGLKGSHTHKIVFVPVGRKAFWEGDPTVSSDWVVKQMDR